MTLRLDHIQLAIPAGGEDQARTFWCQLIGLPEIRKPAALQGRGGLWLALAGAKLHLGVETPFAPAGKAHPGFLVEDIEALAMQLNAADHPLQWDAALKDRKRFFTTDPFGNRLEFLAYDASPQPAP
ncbi:VOC family protein [Sulfitobacter sp. M368]|uniref:VOC family protein n=1 Tax=Sulfitobacter sp. M368 TaxID=2867021 RepID=UPI0021A4D20E|nr:VOC family protein [Sulfitobacter sp. M368]UWR15831.1 glyoxalase [Sulfitobacter sp. M368]